MSITKEQSQAYKEVIQVLNNMSQEDVEKIPKEIFNYYRNNMDISYEFEIDKTKSFEEQNLSEKAKIVLAILYRDYWASQEQKDKIKRKENYDLQQLELEKAKEYNSDDLFKNKKTYDEETTALVEYKKEPWYRQFINFMKKLFDKK